MNNFCKIIICSGIAGLIAVSSPISAKDDDTSLGRVVVAGQQDHAARTGDVDKDITSSSYKVIDRADFDKKTENLAQVIEKESGIQVQSTGGLGSYSTVSLRGSTGKQVLVFLDGVLLNEASGGGFDLSNISLNDVQSIEIYKGSVPANFSRSAIGGAINIKTIRNKGKLTGNVSIGYGSFDTRKSAFFLTHKPGKFDYVFSADHVSSDNDFKITNDNGTIYNKEDDKKEKRNNNNFHQQNFLLKSGYDLTDDVRTEFTNQFFNKLQHLPGPHNSELVDTTFLTRRNVSTLSLTADKLSSLKLNTKSTLDYSWQYENYDDSEASIGLGNQHNEYTTTSYGYRQFFEIPLPANIVLFNFDLRHEVYSMYDLLNSKEYNPSNRKSFNGVAEDSILLLSEKLIIKPSVRYSYTKDSVDDYQDAYGTDQAGFSHSSSHFTPQLGVKYKVKPWLSLKGNAGQYIREPSFFELFGDRGLFKGNPELKEEKGTNFDIGFEFEKQFELKSLQKATLEVTCFQSRVDDIISYIYTAQGVGHAENLSRSEIKGVETSLTTNYFNHFKLTLNYTYQECINYTNDYDEPKYLPGRFMHSFFVRTEYYTDWINIYFEQNIDSNMYYDTPNLNKAKDRYESNCGATIIYSDFSFTLEAKNIFNVSYEDFNGYPKPGRAFYLTVKYDIR